MTTTDDPQATAQDARIDALVQSLPAVEPPAGFADRVVAAHSAAPKQRRSRSRALLGAVVGLDAAALVAFALTFVVHSSSTGEATAGTHQTVKLGDEVAAVLEPGAALKYTIDDGVWQDRVDVQQHSGHAFYRVEPGNAVTVHTPAGDVVVRGTCFTVEVLGTRETDTMHSTNTPFPKTIAAGALGAIIGAGVVVGVYEGEVAIKNQHGELRVHPGESATFSASTAPTRGAPSAHELVRLKGENQALQEALVASRQALAGDPRKLADENAALKARLAKAEQELALVDAARADVEGKEIDAPTDLPSRFNEQALVKAFSEALKHLGVKGDVTHIDCAEYPCIVYGDIELSADLDAMTLGERLKSTPALAAYHEDGENASWWRSRQKDKVTGEDIDETHFGIALYPKSDEEKRGADIEKRIGHRNREMFEAMRTPRK